MARGFTNKKSELKQLLCSH